MTGAEDFDFNFATPLPVAALAADAVTDEARARLFADLEAAAAQWSDPTRGPQKSALAALQAVSAFLHANPHDGVSRFSRPFDLLWLELQNAPAADPGKILPPWDSRQSPDRARRQAVNYLKGAAAYAVERLYREGRPLHAAGAMVADCLAAYRFPFAANRDKEAWRAVVAWRAQFRRPPRRVPDAARTFQRLCANAPTALPASATGRDVIAWLSRELGQAGYERAA